MAQPLVWVVGSGGREHALVSALLAAPSHPRVIAVPGSDGMPSEAERADVDLKDPEALKVALAGVSLVVVGPEAPLVDGLADRVRALGVPVLGPGAAAAQLEGSKAFAKAMMRRTQVPTAAWERFEDAAQAKAFARTLSGGAVVKADGLAAGKGVVVADDMAEADAAIDDMLAGAHGGAGRTLVVEERLEGEELSVLALCDGKNLALLPPSQDHKRLEAGDRGPNTGGMGAYAPAPRGTPELVERVRATCMQPVVDAMAEDGTPLVGVLYAGVMLTPDGPKVLEYNVRFGDPETQAVLPLVDEDLYAAFLDAARGELQPRTLATKPGAALTVVMAAAGYPVKPRKGDVIDGLDAAEAAGAHIVHAGTRRDEQGRWLTHGGRVLGVTARGETLAAAAEKAYLAVERVRFEGAQYRADIGHRALPG